MLKNLFKGNLRKIIAVAALLVVISTGTAFANEVQPLGRNEKHNYAINIFAVTSQYNSDTVRAITSRGLIDANISGVNTIDIQVTNASGSVLTSPVRITNGTRRIFTNTYGGMVQTRPQAKAVYKDHQVIGTWTYYDL